MVRDRAQYRREYYLENKEAELAKNKAYRQTHPEGVKGVERAARYRAAFPEKVREVGARYRASHREELALRRELRRGKRFEKDLMVKYGLLLSEWNTLLISQGGRCDICSTPLIGYNEPCVDHPHTDGWADLSTGEKRSKIRGLLCARCNKAIGLFKDNVASVICAVEYLNRRSAQASTSFIHEGLTLTSGPPSSG